MPLTVAGCSSTAPDFVRRSKFAGATIMRHQKPHSEVGIARQNRGSNLRRARSSLFGRS